MKTKYITKTIWLLSFVSLFTDVSSEMLYPVMPMFLKSVGFSVFMIGILEGLAEAVAGFGKGYFGKMSDRIGKRAPFIQLGYFLSSIAKPIMALFPNVIWIFSARSLDKIGKGVRTGARDAILSAETSPEFKGRVFGFHRSFDTIGAAIGPAFALIYLYFNPDNYIALFYIAFAPAIIGTLITFFVKDKKNIEANLKKDNSKGFFAFLKYWKIASIEYKHLIIGLLFFALINSSDVFLILMAKHIGLKDVEAIGAYIFYNLVYAIFSHPFGALGDKIGLKRTFCLGLIFFACAYGLLSVADSIVYIGAAFLLYGVFSAASEGISKAWISNISNKNEVATAIGFYTSWQSIFTLAASSIAGALWSAISPQAPFILAFIGSLITLVYIILFVKKNRTI